MRIGIISSAIPFENGGYRAIAEWLEVQLRKRGHDVETVYIPSKGNPDTLLEQMLAFRSINLSAYERVITFRPPAHVVQHPCKVVWFIHHIRMFYDLWDSPYRPFPDIAPFRALRDQIVAADTAALSSAHRVFSNSRVVANRLVEYNGIMAEVLYPPVLAPERFSSGEYGDAIVCICRMEHHKRQHLLVEAMAHTHTAVRLLLCGTSLSPGYVAKLQGAALRPDVRDRVVIEKRWISEDEKVAFLKTALASAYVPFREDSYGYPTIEAAHARRCTVTVSDSGGVPEFVVDGTNGLITPPDPVLLGAAFDRLYSDRASARRMGEAASDRIAELGVDWDTVTTELLA